MKTNFSYSRVASIPITAVELGNQNAAQALARRIAAQAEATGTHCFWVHGHRLAIAQVTRLQRALKTRNSLSVAVNADLEAPSVPLKMPAPGALKLIHWQNPRGPIAAITGMLMGFAKAGVWNHLELTRQTDGRNGPGLRQVAYVNANIVHSWSMPPNGEETYTTPYSQVSALAEKPIWRVLDDPERLLAHIHRWGLGRVVRQRITTAGELIELGTELSYHYCKPEDLSPERMEEVCRMVEAGGSVEMNWVRYNLERAFLIAYARERGALAGCSSLKHPRPEMTARVKRQSGVDVGGYLERGYTSVRPEYRGTGIGTRLLEGLTRRAGDYKIFALISEDNMATQKIARRNRTRKVAVYVSEASGKPMGVWVPEWMIPKYERGESS